MALNLLINKDMKDNKPKYDLEKILEWYENAYAEKFVKTGASFITMVGWVMEQWGLSRDDKVVLIDRLYKKYFM